MFGKPNYIPEEFLIVTKHGWVDCRTNEILVSINGLDEKIKKLQSKQFDEPIVEKPLVVATIISEKESKVEPKAESKESILDLLSQPNSLTMTMDADFSGIDIEVITELKDDSIVDVIEEVVEEKRKAGRPKKVVVETTNDAPKRKAGRPKKTIA